MKLVRAIIPTQWSRTHSARSFDASLFRRSFSTSTTVQKGRTEDQGTFRVAQHTKEPILNIREYLSKPSWSVESLLPKSEPTASQPPVSPQKLRHLLRLSALPEPKDASEEAKMLDTLTSQLYFVQEIQKVDTTGVEPLRALRDESMESEKVNEITVASLKEALDQEEVVGTYHKRIRRKIHQINITDNPKGWKPLDHAERKVGNFFVVDSGTPPPT
ncbi:hypothetical protein FKW77_007634 [Venturia effusa]|uniref:Glutamyl-tRNA amidotransferase complex subunit Gta3 domain-containing protein n=1 Tax=Venturia effusa TaxID=50376 RepID=A0A517LE47_9PEZI|nr:hypothetical protein FKW77_007634 [Venturia effusa]